MHVYYKIIYKITFTVETWKMEHIFEIGGYIKKSDKNNKKASEITVTGRD